MKNRSALIGVLALIAVFLITGCGTIHVSMDPMVSTADISDKRIQEKIGLYLDAEFINYRFHDFSKAELADLDYELGSASKAVLLETLTHVSPSVQLVEKRPPYALQEQIDVSIVVEPHIALFSEDHSMWIRNGDFTAHIEYRVIVYDHRGTVLQDKVYKADGLARGSMDPRVTLGSRYAAPVEIAMAKIAVQIVDDLTRIKVPGP